MKWATFLLLCALVAIAVANLSLVKADVAADHVVRLSATQIVHPDAQESKETKEQKPKKKLTQAEIDERAREADREVEFISHSKFASKVSKDTWLIFWGARWCNFCKRLTPRWLKLQKAAAKVLKKKNFHVAKVDCTDDEAFCEKYGVDAYPTIILYNNGEPIEEYNSAQDARSMFDYAKQQAKRFFKPKHDEL